MDKYGPLFHRNGARLLPQSLVKCIIAVALVIGFCELLLGIASIVH